MADILQAARAYKKLLDVEYQIILGKKNTRYADVVVFDKNGNVAEIHQVGRSTKSGLPVARERKAIEDIKKSKDYNGAKIIFHAYDQ